MRTDKHLSLLMVFLVLGSSLVTFCSASESRSQEVHFIAQSCESHDCGRHSESRSCAPEKCQHEICSYKSALGEYVPENSIQLEAVVAAPVLITDNFILSDKEIDFPITPLIPPLIPALHSTVLRI
ncbi:MAG: hypothetical protein GX556_15440 [Fibrobacter sp.]|nr:hypothetical protein [Fibrobacter sp.]